MAAQKQTFLALNNIVKDMTYKQLKTHCVERGMGFEEVLNADFFKLNNFAQDNYMVKPDKQLVVQYDNWLDELLVKQGKADLVHPALRLSHIGDDVEKKPKKIKQPRKPRKKRVKTKDGIYKGTKKAFVYECQEKGFSIRKTLRKVARNFDSFSEKSVKIWYKRAEKR